MTNDKIRFKIDKPCHEEWDKMEKGVNSRKCINCDKNVIDFTQKTKKEILEYLKLNKSVCGRFLKDQIEINNTYPEVIIKNLTESDSFFNSKISLYTIIISSIIIFNSCENQEKNHKPVIENGIIKKDTTLTNKTIENTNQVLPSATNPDDLTTMGEVVIQNTEDNYTNINAENIDEPIPYGLVDIKPKYKGGFNEFKIYLTKKLSPLKLKGEIFLIFTIDKFGSIGNVKIKSDFNKKTENRILTIIKKSPRWIPGRENNEKVETSVAIPIKIE